MPKITFVYPDFESLGIEYLMAVCIKDGHDVDFVYYEAEDAYLGGKTKTVPFHQIAREIADTQPQMAAFSCVTDNYRYQLGCAKALKEILPDVITIFGGVHPTAVPRKVLLNDEVDCVAVGEAECSLSTFLRESLKGGRFVLPKKSVKGLLFKQDGRIVGDIEEGALGDLNKMPFPHKEPFSQVLKDVSHEYRIITSRGCPYSCSYCFNSHFHKLRGKRLIRQRSVENVIRELVWARRRYSFRYVLFCDDSFTTNERWVLEFSDRYKKEVGLPFACLANPQYLSRRVICALKRAGCINMQIGIQSLSEQLCKDVLQRKTDNETVARVIDDVRRVGIMVQVDHMLGIPGDTLEQQVESISFYNRHRPNLISVFWLAYYPKTAIAEMARQNGLLSERDIDKIEEGIRLTDVSYLTGGSMSDPRQYYGISLLLNYLPLMPRILVRLFIWCRLYRVLRIGNYFISTALPRAIQAVFNRKDFRGRSHIIRFIGKKVAWFKSG